MARHILRRVVRKASEQTIFRRRKDLVRRLQGGCTDSSVEFLKSQMPAARPFPTRSALLEYSLQDRSKDGFVAEFGVFKGATVNLIAELVSSDITVYGFDSFRGLPEEWNDLPSGKFAVKKLPRVRPNVQLVPGLFDVSLPKFLQDSKLPASFVHIDCDLYTSTKSVLSQLKSRLQPGSVVVFDEYFNYEGWENGEHRAFREELVIPDQSWEYIAFCPPGEQVAVRRVR